jgi:hypothetical protein
LVHRKYTQETLKANPQQLTENGKRTPEPKKESPKQPTKEPNETREKTHRPERIPTTHQSIQPYNMRAFPLLRLEEQAHLDFSKQITPSKL